MVRIRDKTPPPPREVWSLPLPEQMQALREHYAAHEKPRSRRPRGWRYIEAAQRELDQHTPSTRPLNDILPAPKDAASEDEQRYSTGRSIDGKPGH